MYLSSELGTPSEAVWQGWSKLPEYPACGFNSYPLKAYDVPNDFDEEGSHMLQQLLKVVPDERLTIEDAMVHPFYLSGIYS
ncbi:hypothetical protein KSS87_003874 [Heliosperma pusillum]|nr:hypothetical protein KSS87_003874 [Heliosperma pusillum]